MGIDTLRQFCHQRGGYCARCTVCGCHVSGLSI